jgi:hypothetical protein
LISGLLIGSAFVPPRAAWPKIRDVVSDPQSCIMNHLVVGSAGVAALNDDRH